MLLDPYRISSNFRPQKRAANCKIDKFSEEFHDFYQKVRAGLNPDLPHPICDPYGFFLICKDVITDKNPYGCGFNQPLDEKTCFNVLSKECEDILKMSFETLDLSARARSRIIKVARTIADLDMSENIEVKHILEAVSYRGKFN